MFFYTTHSLDVVNNYSRRNNRNRTIHDDHRESQLSEDGVSVENNKDFTKVKDQSHSDDVTQVTYEPNTEESLYANSAVAVSSFEGYVARKMARTKELSDDYKVLYYLDIIKKILKDFENSNYPFFYHYKQTIDPYWPHDVGDSLTLDDFKIKTEAVDRSVDYITRIMSVSRGSTSSTSPHGKIKRSLYIDKFSQGPLIVHCRTNTFFFMKRWLSSSSLVTHQWTIRSFRPLLQTSFSLIQGTQVMTRITKELQTLNELKKSTINPRRDGLKPENVNKNRNKDVIPDRGHLLTLLERLQNWQQQKQEVDVKWKTLVHYM
ncbi:hypothetical protein LSH36_116g00000 [Paralvinella palmiformis]|uniref:Uncharacterized protein n=1 Tax=Paralvinella palmiformis TaxID=53620 RepID=A0AAD9N947_9ANNE|nr:hypothetical protein LSH36_116g00000 [Paralvinella palmiformis]